MASPSPSRLYVPVTDGFPASGVLLSDYSRENEFSLELGRVYTTSKPTSTGKIVMVIHETVPYISGNQ